MYPHGVIPGNSLPPRDPSPCPLDEDCGAIVVDLLSTSTSSASLPAATTCTTPTGAIPIGFECFDSGPHAGQCISIECLEHPNNCGCPGAPPPEARKEKRSVAAPLNYALKDGCNPITTIPVIPSSTSTSTVTSPSPICTNFHGPVPIGTECFISGPRTGECITFECLERPDTCGCPGAPPPAAGKEKRVILPEPIGSICFQNGTCITFECLDFPDSPGCETVIEKRSETLPIPIGSMCR